MYFFNLLSGVNFSLWRDPVNTGTNGRLEFGCIISNKIIEFYKLEQTAMYGRFTGTKNSGRNNEVPIWTTEGHGAVVSLSERKKNVLSLFNSFAKKNKRFQSAAELKQILNQF